MSLETGSYLADLNAANPAGTDPKAQGDDHIRLIKSVLKNSFAGFGGAVVVTGSETQGATADDYVLTVTPALAAYAAGMMAVFKAAHANTGAATLKIGALTAKALKAVDGGALEGADIESGSLCAAFYDGTDFLLISGNDRAARGGDSYSGLHDFTAAVARVATQGAGDGSTKAASTAYVDAADALKAPLASPALTGVPTAPTAAPGTNDTQLATTAFATQLAFQAALPVQTGNGGKFLQTDGSAASWEALSNVKLAKSSSYTVASADQHRHLVLTGSATLSLLAAAPAGDGFLIYVRNDGSGRWLIDPSGAETIDGRASIYVYPGEAFTLISDGAGWRTFGRGRLVLISSMTVSTPVASVDFEIGFDDAEFRRFELVGDAVSPSLTATGWIRVKKAGAYLTAGYVSGTGLSFTGAGTIGAGSAAAFRAGLSGHSETSASALVLDVVTAGGPLHSSQSTAAAAEGVQVVFDSAAAIDAGSLAFYGVR